MSSCFFDVAEWRPHGTVNFDPFEFARLFSCELCGQPVCVAGRIHQVDVGEADTIKTVCSAVAKRTRLTRTN